MKFMRKVDKEQWSDIDGYKGKYQVSSYGRIWSLGRIEYVHRNGHIYARKHKGHLLHLTLDFDHYFQVTLTKNGHKHNYKIHRLVGKYFCKNSDPKHKTQIDHIDENTEDNYYKNLRWVTPKFNADRKNHIRHVTIHEKNHAGRDVILIGHGIVKIYPSLRRAAKFIYDNYGGSFKTIQTHLSRIASPYSKRQEAKGFTVRWYNLPHDKEHIHYFVKTVLDSIQYSKEQLIHKKSSKVLLYNNTMKRVFDYPNKAVDWVLKNGFADSKRVTVRNAITAVCRGKRKHCYGFRAKYIK